MLIIAQGPNNETKEVNSQEDFENLPNESINAFYIPQWVTSVEELDRHITMMHEVRAWLSQ